MYAYFPFFAEIGSQGAIFWEYSNPPQIGVWIALLFLALFCCGVALDFALVIGLLKRPPRVASWGESLKSLALPGRQVLLVVASLIALYVANSWGFHLLFPQVHGADSTMLVFQGLAFNLPAALVIAWGLMRHRKAGAGPRPPAPLRRISTQLGLSILLYLAAVPFLWFYSMLYQLFLQQFGVDFSLQAVAQLFLAPVSALQRVLMYLTAIVFAPAFEELFFRGVLLPWAVRRMGFWPGVLAISLLFAAIHVHLPALVPLFLLSLFFCVAYARTRSLWVPIGMHACFNAVTVFLLSAIGG